MPPRKSLNPSASAFIANGGGGMGAFGSANGARTAPSSAGNDLGLSNLAIEDSDHDSVDHVILGVPHNTPVLDNSSSSRTPPKVTGSVGHGWKTAFPATATITTPGAKVNHNNTSVPNPAFPLSRAPPFLRTANPDAVNAGFGPRSPPAAEILPSDTSRRDSSKAKLALQHLDKTFSPTKDSMTSPKHSTKFNPFNNQDDEDILVNWGARSPTSPRYQIPARSNSSSTWSARNNTAPSSPLTPSPTSLADHYFTDSVKHQQIAADAMGMHGTVGEGRNVYLPDLPSAVTEEVLRTLAEKHGRIVSVKVENSNNMFLDAYDMLPDGARRGTRTCYAFVMFEAPQAARAFMDYMTKHTVNALYGKETPHLKQKALEDPHSSNLYVAEIPFDTTEMEMRELFFPGVISSLRFLTDDQGNRRGTAMVRLQSRAQAEEAIRRLDLNTTLRGCTKPLQVRIADSENQKLLKKQTPRVADPVETVRRASRGFAPTSPTSARPTSSISQEMDDETLLQHRAAIEEELRRRQISGSLARRPSVSVLQRTPSREPMSPLSPAFDFPGRRYSDDGPATLQSYLHQSPASRRPSLGTPVSRAADSSPFTSRSASRRPSFAVPTGRPENTGTWQSGTKTSSSWSSNASHDLLSGSVSTGSSLASAASYNNSDNVRRLVSDIFRDSSREAF